MLLIQIRLIWRQLKRFRLPYLISISGLLLAFTASILLFRYVYYQFSIDGFHDDPNRLLRLHTIINQAEGQHRYAATAFELASGLQDRYPGIAQLVRIRAMPTIIQAGNHRFDEEIITYVDSGFFDVFSFDLLEGDRNKALKHPNQVVITEELADKYFPGDTSPLGRILNIQIGNEHKNVTLCGIIKNPPPYSTIQFEILGSMDLISHVFRPGYASLVPGLFTYLRLHSDAKVAELASLLNEFVKTNIPGELQEVMAFESLPLRDVYFERGYEFDLGLKGNKVTVYSISVLAILTLLMAVINYVNIHTALTLKRTKEISVRKILGSTSQKLVSQLFYETFFLVSISLIPAILCAILSSKQIDRVLDLEITTGIFADWIWIMIIPGLILFITFLAGSNPALIVSRLSLTDGLKKKVYYFHRFLDLKKILLMSQLTVSVFFIITAFIVYDQLQYLREKDPGFIREDIILVDIAGPQYQQQIPTLKEYLLKVPGVLSLSASTSPIYGTQPQVNVVDIGDSATNQGFLCHINYVDADFLQTYGVQLQEGRNFDSDIPTDTRNAILINQKAAIRMGLTTGKNVLGSSVEKIGRDTTRSNIIGVIRDYHFQPLYQEIEPIIWEINPDAPKNTLAIRLKGQTQEILAGLENEWNLLRPGESFNYVFLDQAMIDTYRSEQQMSYFIRLISIILLLITATGMYGMMLFIVEQKKQEMGIRKTLGAHTGQLVIFLHRQYSSLMIIGSCFGAVLAYLLTLQWLQQFSYRIQPGWSHYLGSIGFCFFVITITILFQTFRASRSNPTEVLKSE